jgi:hypothetical protein
VISRDQLIEEMGKAYYRLHDPRQRITPLVRMRAAMDKHDELMRPQNEAFTKLLEAAKKAREHILELEDAFRSGALNSCDGRNGLRSDTIVDIHVALDGAIAAAEEALK